MELMGVVNKGKKFGLMADKEIEFFLLLIRYQTFSVVDKESAHYS
jgi:hypothetical protein